MGLSARYCSELTHFHIWRHLVWKHVCSAFIVTVSIRIGHVFCSKQEYCWDSTECLCFLKGCENLTILTSNLKQRPFPDYADSDTRPYFLRPALGPFLPSALSVAVLDIQISVPTLLIWGPGSQNRMLSQMGETPSPTRWAPPASQRASCSSDEHQDVAGESGRPPPRALSTSWPAWVTVILTVSMGPTLGDCLNTANGEQIHQGWIPTRGYLSSRWSLFTLQAAAIRCIRFLLVSQQLSCFFRLWWKMS